MSAGDASQLHENSGMVNPHGNAKLEQLYEQFATGNLKIGAGQKGGQCPFLALQTGMKYMDDDNSAKAGVRGPTLLEDQVLREKINHFDHERIPERVVHARGVGVHGEFQVYKSLAHVSSAQVFADPSVKTPTFVRFSTVLGSRGSPDTVRDVRGFATKFYTQEGNWDLVGNNIPVFFIQDPMKFPDIIHAGKPDTQTDMPQAQTAHDNFWDFISFTPESMHMIMWAMSDRTLPRSFRMMQGFGVHTFALINAEGKRTFAKFHWRPLLGVHGLAWDECLKINGADPDFHHRDLYENIVKGNFPEYELGLQLIAEADEEKFTYDLLDDTKIVPEEEVPIEWIGKMTLNRIPTDFFAEVEQVAFCTQNIVPGMDFTNDPMLQGRNFSYLDTQLTRLGGPNFNQIPINRPLVEPFNNQRDGFMQMKVHTDKLNYFPNRNQMPRPGNGGETQGHGKEQLKNAFMSYAAKLEGMKVRTKAPKFREHFAQAQMFFNSMSEVEQAHIRYALSFELGKVDDLGVKNRMIAHLNNIHPVLATQVARAIGVPPPTEAPQHPNKGQVSQFLSMVESPYAVKASIATRKVAVLVADGYRAAELSAVVNALQLKNGAECVFIGPRKGKIFSEGMSGDPASASSAPAKEALADPTCKSVPTMFTFDTCRSVLFDSVIVVGGGHVATLLQLGRVSAFLAEALMHCKAVALVGEAVALVKPVATLCEYKIATDADGGQVIDDQALTTVAQGNGSGLVDLLQTFITNMKAHRKWDRRNVERIPA